jgi:hypothetical protein
MKRLIAKYEGNHHAVSSELSPREGPSILYSTVIRCRPLSTGLGKRDDRGRRLDCVPGVAMTKSPYGHTPPWFPPPVWQAPHGMEIRMINGSAHVDTQHPPTRIGDRTPPRLYGRRRR